jgi:hypothetical protein
LKKTKEIFAITEGDEKEIQKADGMGYYSSILNMYIFKVTTYKQNYGNFAHISRHANIKRLHLKQRCNL